MTVEAGAAATAVGVELLLVGHFDAAALDQPDQRDMQALGDVGHPQDVLRLPRDPGAGQQFVVEADDDGPAAADLAETVDDVGGAFVVGFRIVKAVQREEAAFVDEIFDALPHRQRTALVDLGRRDTDFLARLAQAGDLSLDGLEFGAAFLRARDAVLFELPAEARHRLKIRPHPRLPHIVFSRPTTCRSYFISRHSRFGVKPQAMPEMMIFWMLDVPSTTCSDLASR